MMAEKHLRDLLLVDQEPFLLKHYISDRRTLLKRTSPNTTLRKNTSNSNFPLNKCLLSFHNATKSPLLEFAPPTKKESQLRPSNAKTATLLLEAALRIHKHAKPKPNRAFGIFGSLFKKLKNQRTREHINNDVRVAVVGSCEGRPSSSGVWSESNEDKSLDLETCSSGHSFDDSVEQEIQFVNTRKLNSHDLFFCQTPFRFSLQRSPDYSPRRTPEFSSPLASPCRHTTQDNETNSGDGVVNKFQSGKEEEDKEQCSPVSVLDPPFDDDDNDHGEDGFDLDSSYANVQRTTQDLLDRLRRFEKLAGLDPVELEKRMLDQEDKEYETFIEEDDYDDDVDIETECGEEKVVGERSVVEILSHSRVDKMQQAPEDLKRLVYDLIMEEETEINSSEERNTVVIRRVCRRLDLWKEVKCNTIDMMIEEDFSGEEGRWKKNAEQTGELVQELELAIFCYLVEELSEELVC
ncbi:hypothetical protein PHAVU_007G222400 [Phaseolus vulgaris]|uniref:DUF4378 domain-containing protein n=1 Tax=Phaseolus vulgaris TaxID=3885 RepID=V7BH59_PHAVU|nr:hypothetical protein PHAVU_007G222400g [Phaseolus vulgaris]ESW17234.1 hypothetical protein PHAVU_007G222400g [Phaseolus vulgaris]